MVSKTPLLSLEDAIAIVMDNISVLQTEQAELLNLAGRICANPVIAKISQPPFAASAMDGYAVQFADAQMGAALKLIGEAPAGKPFTGRINKGEAVRIFTGAVIPQGANHIVIQEDASRSADIVHVDAEQKRPRHIRAAGPDFHAGDCLADKGICCTAYHAALFASANIDSVAVVRKPVVGVFSNGGELRSPGSILGPGEIIDSNRYALIGLLQQWGAASVDLGCVPDDPEHIKTVYKKAAHCDLILSIGGASVGEHDYVKQAFCDIGGHILFDKIAIKPGKPTWFGDIDGQAALGLPGNPAAALVMANILLRPLIGAMLGTFSSLPFRRLALRHALDANGPRESYLRALYAQDDDGVERARVHPAQDSSLLFPFAQCNILVRRQPYAPAAKAGDFVDVINL